MDFFEAQDDARNRTRILVILFLLAVVVIIATVYGAVSAGLIAYYANESDFAEPLSFWDPIRFAVTAVSTALVIFLGSSIRTMQFREGGGAVARSLGGRKVDPTTRNPEERVLTNVIEEMSIASGTAMPEVYVLDREEGINAFAAGFTPNDAAVVVTRGCLERLSRDELQGVIGHEFSHILNGDMRLNMRLAGILFGILVIGITGRLAFELIGLGGRGGSSTKEKVGETALAIPFACFYVIIFFVGLAIMVIGYLGEFFGRLIQASVSRQREFLADAAAVQFTRNPGGIGDALRKIGGFWRHSTIRSSQASGIAHCFVANALRSSGLRMMSTHPPLAERIRAIDPNFDGEFIIPAPDPGFKTAPVSPKTPPHRSQSGKFEVEPVTLVATVGQLQASQINEARSILEGFSEKLVSSLHEPLNAAAAIFVLILHEDEALRKGQLLKIAEAEFPGLADAVENMASVTPTADISIRIPLIEIAIQQVKILSPEFERLFLALLDHLIEFDETVSLFEFCLRRIVRQRIAPKTYTLDRPVADLSPRIMPNLIRAAGLVLSAAVHLTAGETEEKRGILTNSVDSSPLFSRQVGLIAESEIHHSDLDDALDRFLTTPFGVRKQFLQACAKIVGHDGTISQAEFELLRAVSAGIACPMPAILPSDAILSDRSGSDVDR